MGTPSEYRGHPLDRYLELRDSLRVARIAGGGGEVCAALTDTLDQAISDLTSPVPVGMAVVAIGGYGRGELSPHSDIDLMLLHSGGDPANMAAELFRPLWDAKLRVGHSVRTLKEASTAAKERFDSQTTMLTSRLVAGDEDLFRRLMEVVTTVTRARPLRRYLVSEERARRDTTPYLLMATDVKSGRGGLRTLHGFGWEGRREELIGRFSTDSTEDEERAREVLLRVRNGLHVVTGRSHDVFSPDLREPVARWLDMDVFACSKELVDAMQTVDRLATRRWPEVVDQRGGGVWGRLVGKSAASKTESVPPLADLVSILEAGERGQLILERLAEEGRLDTILPGWAVIRSLPQLAPFHEHPVASHLWRTVDEMRHLIADDGHYGRIASELGDPTVLLLAAFLHDIGKGGGGDHAVLGGDLARSLCERLELSPIQVGLVSDAVRLHLLLATTATRRDLDDPAVVDAVAVEVGSLQLLQLLYLLTVADSKATGQSMWSEWKATLVRTLFRRCAGRFAVDRESTIGIRREDVIASVEPALGARVRRHLDGLPDEYLRSVTVEDVLWHLELIASLDGASLVGVRPNDPIETAVVVGREQSGFRRRVAEAYAANGVDVLEARLFSHEDGTIVDSFRVRDDRTGEPVAAARWDSLRADVEAGLRGDLDTGAKMAKRAASYHRGSAQRPTVRGSRDVTSGELVITIRCDDRIGRLAEILRALEVCGLDIRLAKIDSRGGEVVDTFYTTGAHGASIESLEARLAVALGDR